MSERHRLPIGWPCSPGLLFTILLIAPLMYLSGCGSGQTDVGQANGNGNSVAVSLNISMPQESAVASTVGSRFWATVQSWLPSVTNALAATADLRTLTVEVTAEDLPSPITATQNLSEPVPGDVITFILDVPVGPNRVFTVSGLDTTRVKILGGQSKPTTLITGKAATVAIPLVDVTTRPTADAGPDQNTLVGRVITLTGSASSDPNGDPLTYSWTFILRPKGSTASFTGPTTVSPTFMADVLGVYVVSLVVRDGINSSAADTMMVTAAVNPIPIANAGPDQTVLPGVVVSLDGSASSDANGDPLTYSWVFVSRPTDSAVVLVGATTVNPTFTVDLVGSYVVVLTVHDGVNPSPVDTVTVNTANRPPIANAGSDERLFFGSISLDGSKSSDPDGNSLTYRWDFTDVPSSESSFSCLPALSGSDTARPSFSPECSGFYTLSLIVNDGTVDSAPDTVRLEIVSD